MHVLDFLLGEDDRALEASRPRANNEHALVRAVRRHIALWVPAAPILLARRRILGADDPRHHVDAGHADVAADALPDLFDPAFVDLGGEERVGDRRASGPDDVLLPA